MQFEEKNLIEKLFQRLQKAEENASIRDNEAEKQIQDAVKEQPAAPYYMVQSILIQEAALNKLNQQILKLKNELFQLQMTNQAKGKTFLSRLFGSNQHSHQMSSKDLQQPVVSSENRSYSSGTSPRNGVNSFMTGALQTAAGVAGGVVIGNMLNNMFHHSAPEEIINIIDDPSSSVVENDSSLLNSDLDVDNLDGDMFDYTSDSQLISDDQLSNGDFDIGNFGDDDFI
ncbi:ABC transporter substrate-binding protein (plasmid) [Candidatus Pantoea edessiphila]|uniref:ABC transporter substrate-binding protein n=1 Tax=Candidatus Pantoea edessiphila TaxID=2044610 RepID=A0A2P5SZ84_9GAMM|nr:DUF2076 domain-containing protein [Candidatus Pantoea edessiphila]PPI87623.1 ABC transporter substrate-binding protein [Candidatus Pantoea edessiphila]